MMRIKFCLRRVTFYAARRGITYLYNEYVYAEENPHTVKEKHSQREFIINVWMDCLDSNRYLNLLQKTV